MRKIGRNDPCTCGSGKKFKKYCLDNKEDVQKSVGVLRSMYSIKKGDDFFARFIMQMSQIRGCAYPREKHLEYDKSFNPIFQNLVEAKFVMERLETLVETHKKKLKEGHEGKFHGSQIDIKEPIDDELNLYFKDFFIRANMAIECLIRHTSYMDHSIAFLFSGEEKKRRKGLGKFPLDEKDERFRWLTEFVAGHRESWYKQCRELRRKIEHEGFSLPHLSYQLKNGNKVEALFPAFGEQQIMEAITAVWENLTSFCEEITVFLLSLRLGEHEIIVLIPEDQRAEHLNVKYAVRLKEFPNARYSSG